MGKTARQDNFRWQSRGERIRRARLLYAGGASVREIGAQVGVSVSTVERGRAEEAR